MDLISRRSLLVTSRGGGMADTKVSKTFELKTRGGSTPPLGTLCQINFSPETEKYYQ